MTTVALGTLSERANRAQRRAIEAPGPVVVEAGAGTGKTWVLVARFLQLLEDDPTLRLDAVIAVTFTEKAAREMRSRIRTAILARAERERDGDDSRDGDGGPDGDRRRGSDGGPDGDGGRKRWLELARNVDGLRVGTVHSLCARLLRDNAIEARLDPRFRVLSEDEAATMKLEAVETCLQALVEADHPGLALLDRLRVVDLRNELLGLLDRRGTAAAVLPDLPDTASELLSLWQARVDAARRSHWASLLSASPELGEAVRRVAGLEITDPTDRLSSVIFDLQTALLSWPAYSDAAAAAFASINLRHGRREAWGGDRRLTELKADLAMLRSAAAEIEAIGGAFGDADQTAAEALLLWREVWSVLETTYATAKQAAAALDFDDLELQALALLSARPPRPRLEAWLTGIKHVLVDEFQDVNRIQRDIVSALLPDDRKGAFVVGDAKQSIYRFRDADVSVFREALADAESTLVRLDECYRAHRELVAATNSLFDHVLAPLGSTHEAHEATPAPLRSDRAPATSLTGESSPAVEVVVLPHEEEGEPVPSHEARLHEADLIADRLLHLAAGGQLVYDRQLDRARPFRFGDAAILLRATTHQTVYEERFREAGLPYVATSGRGFYSRPEVLDLLSLLGHLHNPGDELQLLAALRSPLFGLRDDTLLLLRHQPPPELRISAGSLDASVEPPFGLRAALANPPSSPEPHRVANAHAILTELESIAGRVSVWELLRAALDATGFEAACALDDSAQGPSGRSLGNIQQLLRVARDQGSSRLGEFLRRIDALRARDARHADAFGGPLEAGEAVQIMSVHAAKGLEFPVVVVADLGRPIQSGLSSPLLRLNPSYGAVVRHRDAMGDGVEGSAYQWASWLESRMEIAESKRLLYVACTRAADLLILTGQGGRSDSWLEWVREAWGIAAHGGADGDRAAGGGDGFFAEVRWPRTRDSQRARSREAESAPNPVPDLPPFAVAPARPDATSRQPVRLDAPSMRVRPDAPSGIPDRPDAPSGIPDRMDAANGITHPLVDEQSFQRLRNIARSSEESRAPGRLIGRVVHRALSSGMVHGALRDATPAVRRARLEGWARQEGILGQEPLEHAVASAQRILARVADHALSDSIARARQAHWEVPFTVAMEPRGTVSGIVDLLFEDAAGGWHVVDWKTDWAPSFEAARTIAFEKKPGYADQVSTYMAALESLLGVRPQAHLVFLRPSIRVLDLE